MLILKDHALPQAECHRYPFLHMGKVKQSKKSFLKPGFKPGPTDLKSELLTAWLPRRRLKTK